MRIRIWQEFSSNNSARFTVVGLFETPTAAKNAAEKLMNMIKSIVEWYQKNAEPEAQWDSPPPSPPEIQIAKQYNIKWSEISLDWAWIDNDGNGPVKAFENIVFVDGTDSWLGSSPADKLVQLMGGKVLVDGVITLDLIGEPGTYGTVNLELLCIAPNVNVSEKIFNEIVAYQNRMKEDSQRMFETPWGTRDPMEHSAFFGTVLKDGRNLKISGSFFHIAQGFPALINYLKNQGCDEINYSLIETRESFE